MAQKVNTFKVGTMFKRLVADLGKGDLNELLFNWKESELNNDQTEIISNPYRRNASRGKGPTIRQSKTEFINWLTSDGPFDTNVYGEEILADTEWTNLVTRARDCLNKTS